MNKFEESENIGRQKYLKLGYKTVFTDTSSCIDAVSRIKDKIIAVEIKDRDKQYENCDTFIMEVHKLNYINNLRKEGKVQGGFYVNFFGNSCYIFTTSLINKLLRQNEIKILKQYLPKTSARYSGYRFKEVIYIPKKYAYHCTIEEKELS